MSKELDQLTADVADIKTVAQSAEAMISGLAQQLKDALALGDPTATNAAIQSLANDLEATKAELAAAVAANTPAA